MSQSVLKRRVTLILGDALEHLHVDHPSPDTASQPDIMQLLQSSPKVLMNGFEALAGRRIDMGNTAQIYNYQGRLLTLGLAKLLRQEVNHLVFE